MKRITALFLVLCLTLCTAAYADEAEPMFTAVGVHLSCPENISAVKAQNLCFDLYDGETGVMLDSKSVPVFSSGYIDIQFSVPYYKIGKTFFLHMSSGEAELTHNGQTGAYFTLQTYSTPNSQGDGLLYCTDFYMTYVPAKERVVNLSLDGKPRTDLALYTYPEGILISAEALDALGISSSMSSDGGIMLTRGDLSLLLYPDQLCAYKNGEAFNLALAPQIINGLPFVPVGNTVDIFGCNTYYSDDGCILNLSIGYSTKGQTWDEQRMNSSGVKSDTNYLIWVSKSEYTIRVYTGSKGSWRRINSFPCAIGAPGTPTCEGVYKYYQRQNSWNYSSYYVGPVMRFNGGYAIHSTLLRYDGVPYDNRVGVKISHGCVRVRPEGINWLDANIPLYTTVYVTA